MNQLALGFIVAHSHRLQDLTDLVVAIHQRYPLEVFEQEAILVQSNGIAQWLKHHLARDLGIAAMLDVTLPARFQWRAYRAVLGQELPRESPFDKSSLVWRIMRVLPQHLAAPEFSELRRYMADDDDQRKLFQLSERLADLYDQYQVYRADWLNDWAAGKSPEVPAEQAWQPILWRALLADVGDSQWNNRAFIHQQFLAACEQLTPQQRPRDIPARVVVFGISSLPRQMLEILQALSRICQVVLCVHNPCQYHWADIIDGKDIYSSEVKSRLARRRPGPVPLEQLHEYSHPLLASWGKQGRDYVRLLDQFDATEHLREALPQLKLEMFDEQLPAQPTILDALRSDILHLNSPGEAQQRWAQQGVDDRAIQFHCAHSPQREVEVLHDQLLARFAADPTLKPRDVMVMVPDIDRYAPHIDAVFGRYEMDDKRRIPYSIADQQARHHQPLLIALDYILAIHQQRAQASELFDLLQVPAIQQRFGIHPEQLPAFQQWLVTAGIRWGLDSQHREQLQLPANEQNTWLFGLQRMLMGYAVGDVDPNEFGWGDIEPLADVGGLSAEIVGAVTQFIEVIRGHFQHGHQPRTALAWGSYLHDLLKQLFSPSDDADVVLLNRLNQRLQQWLEAIQGASPDQELTLAVVRESWLSRMDESSLSQRFLAGRVNFATLMPMRAIPFRCVCILGMNDGDYPRSQKPYDFDLMANSYRPGDRSRRDDDRYLFLEAVLSAQEFLYISWQGRSIRDNSEKPPSVLVSQLLEHLQQVYGERQDGTAWVMEHKLQPFHRDYFHQAQPHPAQLFTYAQEWQTIHTADLPATSEHQQLAPWLPEAPLTVQQLVHFLREPARLFTQLRLDTYLVEHALTMEDDEAFVLNGLEMWQVTNTLLMEQLALLRQGGDDQQLQQVIEQHLVRSQRAGQLPLGAAGQEVKGELLERLAAHREALTPWLDDYPQVLPIQSILYSSPTGLSVTAVFPHCFENLAGERLALRLTPSVVVDHRRSGHRPRAQHAVMLWVEHLLLNTQSPTRSVLLGQEGELKLSPLTATSAQELLETMLQWLVRGLQQPLPLELHTAMEGIAQHHDDWQHAFQQGGVEAVHEAAREFYEQSTFQRRARVLDAVYAGRYFPDYAALTDSGLFSQLVTALYEPMMAHLYSAEGVQEEAQ